METGKIVVNGQRVASPTALVRNGDVISHTLHRHEPPVTAQPMTTVYEDAHLLVINKPAGVPVHPAGRYNYNSVVEILRAQRGLGWHPRPCHRLDRLTSGIMVLAKHPKAAEEMGVQIKGHSVRKEYVARVIGEFPAGEVVCDQPIMQVSPKLGLNRARASGKAARTVFRRLAYYPPPKRKEGEDEAGEAEDARTERERQRDAALSWKRLRGYSIVRCLPLTGRTHQLRVHLQFLGHPVANDPIYCNQRVFGPLLGVGDASESNDAAIMSRLDHMGKDEAADAVAYHDELVADYEARKAEKMTGETCALCDTPLYSDPGPHELGIYLHARRYACEEGRWAYETELPAWALPPEGTEGPVVATGETDPSELAAKVEKMEIKEPVVLKDGEAVQLDPGGEINGNTS